MAGGRSLQLDPFRMTPTDRPDIAEFELSELETWLESAGHRRFHARQIFQWVYRRGVSDPAAMTDLPKALRADLASLLTTGTPSVVDDRRSTDGTRKFLLRLHDG